MKPSLDLFLCSLIFGVGFTLAFCIVQTIWNVVVGMVTVRK